MAVLMFLASQPETVVSRGDILDHAWPGATISDEVLSRAIYRARQHLGDSGREAHLIVTIPKKGYRLTVEPDYRGRNNPVHPERSAWILRFWPIIVAAVGIGISLAIWMESETRTSGADSTRTPTPVTRAPAIQSKIAVLPFQNLSGESDKEYFSDGLTEELLNALSQMDSLGVIARTSSFVFKNSNESAVSIGEKLDVDHILQGSVRFDGEEFRVVTYLIDASADTTIWSRTYSGNLDDIFSVQDEITTAIARSLEVELASAYTQAALLPPTTSTEAYKLYLEGRYYFHRRNAGALREAVEFFLQAVDTDSQYALAYIGLADSYMLLSQYGDMPLEEATKLAFEAVSRAIEISPDLMEAHASLGLVHLHNGEYDIAADELRRAASSNPDYVMAHVWLGRALWGQMLFSQALAAYERALKLDPHSPIVNMNVGMALSMAGRFDEAQEHLRRCIEIDPGFANGHWALAYSLRSSGKTAEAVQAYRNAANHGLMSAGSSAQLLFAYLDLGELSKAAEELENLMGMSKGREGSYWSLIAQMGLFEASGSIDERQSYLEDLLRSRPDDIKLNFELMLTMTLKSDAAGALQVLKRLNLDDPQVRDALFFIWDAEAGYLNAVTVANVYRGVNLVDDASSMLEEAEVFLADVRRRGINSPGTDYLEATILCMKQDNEGALRALERAISRGWRSAWWAEIDPNLEPLRRDPGFAGAMQNLRTQK